MVLPSDRCCFTPEVCVATSDSDLSTFPSLPAAQLRKTATIRVDGQTRGGKLRPGGHMWPGELFNLGREKKTAVSLTGSKRYLAD